MEKKTIPDPRGGTIEHYFNFPSTQIQPRRVDVWLPPAYDLQPEQRLAVLYMHDGQNLFDPALAYGGVDWGMDETILRLSAEGQIPAVIVVGIWNSAIRWQEYMPQKVFDLPEAQAIRPRFIERAGGMPISDRYLQFVVAELKPFIDAHYRTRPDPDHTLVMGSSMGGLISLYAALEYPGVFGRAGCVSTHWPAGENALLSFFRGVLPAPGRQRFYFDYGTQTLDANYEPFQLQMDAILRDAGYISGQDFLTLKFEGADHSEDSWRKRVDLPLKFLLK